MNGIISFVKQWTLPCAIGLGTLLYLLFAYVPALGPAAEVFGPLFDWLLPISVSFTLFVTFAKVDFHSMRPHRWHMVLLVSQLLLVGLCCVLIWTVGSGSTARKLALEAVLTCVIAPCASAAPVVTGKIGGSVNGMTTYTLISAVATSVLIPAVFPLIEIEEGLTFVEAWLVILEKVARVILLPLFLGWVVRRFVHPLHRFIMSHPNLGFYCWGFSLSITTGMTVKSIAHSDAGASFLLLVALLSLLVCVMQFALGRRIGSLFGEKICCGQGMFQKNTAMAIWVAYAYLTPIASMGAGCYVLWQNIINSYEIWEYGRKKG